MRKLFNFFLPVLILSIGFVSCEKEEEGPGSSSDLIGTWKIVEVSFNQKENGTIKKSGNPKTEKEILEAGFNLYIHFDEDGKIYTAANIINLKDDDIGTWEMKNGKIYHSEPEGYEGDESTIIELTSTKMVLESLYIDFDDDGSIKSEFYSKTTYTKVK